MIQRARAESETIWRRGYTLEQDEITEIVRAQLARLTPESELPEGVELQIHVFLSPVLNAFAMPDGSIYIFTGLLAELHSFDELAFIIGHEAQHAMQLHGQRQRDQATGTRVLWEGLSIAVGVVAGGTWTGAFSQMGLGLAAAYSVSGYGRGLETESDHLGLQLATAAGYEPCAAELALSRLADEDAPSPGRLANIFWGSHPLLEDRLVEMRSLAGRSCDGPDTLRADYAPIHWASVKLCARQWLADGAWDNALESCRRYERRFPDDVEIHTLIGQAYLEQSNYPRASAGFQKALRISSNEYRPALLGLHELALAQADTVAAIQFLERYLEGDERVPRRRTLTRLLEELRATHSDTKAQPR